MSRHLLIVSINKTKYQYLIFLCVLLIIASAWLHDESFVCICSCVHCNKYGRLNITRYLTWIVTCVISQFVCVSNLKLAVAYQPKSDFSDYCGHINIYKIIVDTLHYNFEHRNTKSNGINNDNIPFTSILNTRYHRFAALWWPKFRDMRQTVSNWLYYEH